MRNVALWLHIMGGGTWLGANLFQLSVSRRLTGGESNVAARWLEAVNKITNPLYQTAATVIVVTGIYLVLSSDIYTFGSVFVAIGIAVVIIGGALLGMVFVPQSKKAMALFSGGNSPEGGQVTSRIRTFAMLDTLLVVFAVLAMVSKW